MTLQVVEYSEKAIAVYGDTKEIKDKLKALGGRFNFRLRGGAGWIFSKKKQAEVEELVNRYATDNTADPAAGMIQAEQEAAFDRFAQENNI